MEEVPESDARGLIKRLMERACTGLGNSRGRLINISFLKLHQTFRVAFAIVHI